MASLPRIFRRPSPDPMDDALSDHLSEGVEMHRPYNPSDDRGAESYSAQMGYEDGHGSIRRADSPFEQEAPREGWASPPITHQHRRRRCGAGPHSSEPVERTSPPEVPLDNDKKHAAAGMQNASPAVRMAKLSQDEWAARASSTSEKVDARLERAQLAENVWGQTDAHLPMMAAGMAAEDAPMKQQATRPNSTSTIFASATVSNPDGDQLILCMAAVLHVQMQHDLDAPEELKAQFLKLSDEHIKPAVMPTVDDIYQYISHIFRYARMSTECNIIALVYINRAISLSGMPLGACNWRPVVLVAMILAQKVWDDKSLRASCFHRILPEYAKEQIKKYEIFFLRILQYSGLVTRALYTRYYFELRDLYERVNGSRFPLRPLSISEAKRLEIVSSGFKVIPKKSSKRRGGGESSSSTNSGPRSSSALSSALSVSSEGSGSNASAASSWSGRGAFPSSGASAPTTVSGGSGMASLSTASAPTTVSGTTMSGGSSWSSSEGGSHSRTWEDATLATKGRYVQS